MPPLEVKVFYAHSCPRCPRIHKVIEEAKRRLHQRGIPVKFIMYDTDRRAADYIADKYGVDRIPSIVIYGSIYGVGVPDIDDLVGLVTYLSKHPEGGKGRRHHHG